MPLQTETLIIGGGLSGLYLAHQLEEQGRDYLLVEARAHFGGRIFSPKIEGTKHHIDMGPAWFWPGQPRMAKLLSELDIAFFDQASRGNLVFEDPNGEVRRDLDMATMEGAHRVESGVGRATETLAFRLPKDRLKLSSSVTKVQFIENELRVSVKDTPSEICAKNVVICVPPRLAERSIEFSPPLPEQTISQLRSCPTWMAAHAKFVAVYDTAFWRDMGLSGDAISHKGPMMELHDASPQSEDANDGPGAIFGFLGIPSEARKGQKDLIIAACKQQLVNLFGTQAASPLEVFYKDWSEDPFTATPEDTNAPQGHPQYQAISIDDGEWQNRLHFSATETAPHFGGFLEGALEAVDNLMRKF